MTGVSYRSTWFMMYRIREAMRPLDQTEPMGGEGHTNTIEGYFSILKRGITGTYHHVGPQHLKRYLGEFDFRYNTRSALKIDDITRASEALNGIKGKRLTYRRTDQA